MEAYHPNKHCESLIDEQDTRDDCWRFLLRVKTWIFFHPHGHIYSEKETNYWEVYDFTTEDERNFRKEFKEVIRKGWGDGAFWLWTEAKKPEGFWCDVEIEWSEREDAHLCVMAINTPQPRNLPGTSKPGPLKEFRPHCAIGGEEKYVKEGGSTAPQLNEVANPIDMRIQMDRVASGRMRFEGTTSEGKKVDFYRYSLQHEFGHYLGCRHFCEWAGGDGPTYCEGLDEWRMEDIMAKGGKFRHAVGHPFQTRLIAHGVVPYLHQISPWVAKGHTDGGGGIRSKRPWPKDWTPAKPRGTE